MYLYNNVFNFVINKLTCAPKTFQGGGEGSLKPERNVLLKSFIFLLHN